MRLSLEIVKESVSERPMTCCIIKNDRVFLPVLKSLYNENCTRKIKFGNRCNCKRRIGFADFIFRGGVCFQF